MSRVEQPEKKTMLLLRYIGSLQLHLLQVMPSLRLLTPLSLLIILVISTVADDSNFLSPQLQDPASLPINFPADFNTDSNSNLVASGWTAADDGNNDNPSDSTGFLASDEIVSNCAGSAPGETPTPIQRRSRLGKRDGGVCRPQQFKDTAPSTGGATTNERPSRIDKTKPAQPIQLEKIMPVLGEPDSPLCHKYFPGSGSNFAVCHYPYFKTIRRIPLVSVLTPCRACK